MADLRATILNFAVNPAKQIGLKMSTQISVLKAHGIDLYLKWLYYRLSYFDREDKVKMDTATQTFVDLLAYIGRGNVEISIDDLADDSAKISLGEIRFTEIGIAAKFGLVRLMLHTRPIRETDRDDVAAYVVETGWVSPVFARMSEENSPFHWCADEFPEVISHIFDALENCDQEDLRWLIDVRRVCQTILKEERLAWQRLGLL